MANKKYNKLCVWTNSNLRYNEGPNTVIRVFKRYSMRIKPYGELMTNISLYEGGYPIYRRDFFFFVHDDDYELLKRNHISLGVEFWSDIVANGEETRYNAENIKYLRSSLEEQGIFID